MAIFKPGSIVADIRGRVGDVIFSRNQGGAIARSTGSWTQPNTQAQIDTRFALGDLATAWSSALDETRRQNWRNYASTNPRPNRWGTPSMRSGYLAFIRHNVRYYIDQGTLRFLDAPTTPALHPPSVRISIDRDSQLATITTPPENYPDPPVELTLYIYSGIPLTAGRTYYSGPWRHLVTITPPTAGLPNTIVIQWTWPTHASPPQYTWPVDGTGETRAYVIAQDNETGAISTRHIIIPEMTTE